eukprot:COSAG01_NODE_22207_length_867_cov_0.690104_1_plen_166_part_00
MARVMSPSHFAGKLAHTACSGADDIHPSMLLLLLASCSGGAPTTTILAAAEQAAAAGGFQLTSMFGTSDGTPGKAVRRALRFHLGTRSILTEIYPCRACSCHEILRTGTAGQGSGSVVAHNTSAIDATVAAAAKVSHLCACIGSPCLRQCVHGASIGGRGRAGVG